MTQNEVPNHEAMKEAVTIGFAYGAMLGAAFGVALFRAVESGGVWWIFPPLLAVGGILWIVVATKP